MTLVLCTPHLLMINWLRSCVMLLILFLKMEIEGTIVFPKKNVAYWGKKSKYNITFSENTSKTFLKHLRQNYYFIVDNSLLRQKKGIPIGISPTLFLTNFFSCTYKNEYMSELISNDKVKPRHFHATKLFIDDLCRDIYLPKLQLKVDNSGINSLF